MGPGCHGARYWTHARACRDALWPGQREELEDRDVLAAGQRAVRGVDVRLVVDEQRGRAGRRAPHEREDVAHEGARGW